jgi:hypothetical protein
MWPKHAATLFPPCFLSTYELLPLGGVGHCFAWHVWVSLSFYFNFKTEELVHSGLCAMWHLGHNCYGTTEYL